MFGIFIIGRRRGSPGRVAARPLPSPPAWRSSSRWLPPRAGGPARPAQQPPSRSASAACSTAYDGAALVRGIATFDAVPTAVERAALEALGLAVQPMHNVPLALCPAGSAP